MIRGRQAAEQAWPRWCPHSVTNGIIARFAIRYLTMRVILAILLLGLAMLSGCGQMGPLYMPPAETPAAGPSSESAEPAEPQGET